MEVEVSASGFRANSSSTTPLRPRLGPSANESWQIVDLDLPLARLHPPLDGHSSLMDAFRIARQQGMPRGKILALEPQPIGAAWRKPPDLGEPCQRQSYTIGHEGPASFIMRATTTASIQQSASDAGMMNFSRVLILQLDEAATPAAVAKLFPLRAGQRGEGFFPESPRISAHEHVLDDLPWRRPGKALSSVGSQTVVNSLREVLRLTSMKAP